MTDPVGPGPSESADPRCPGEPADLGGPSEPADLGGPSEPTHPRCPGEPSEPADPRGPGEPVDLGGPSEPTHPRCLSERSESKALGDLAADALLTEARLTPKPGLVDAENNGAHDDMDLAMFVASAEALRPWFARCAEAGAGGAAPEDLVALGLAAESAMFAATGGVNTHKGALYSLGLACAAAGEIASRAAVPLASSVCLRVAELAHAVSPRPTGEPRTHGERALATLGLAGARGEAWEGFPRVRHHGLPALAKYAQLGWSDDDALRATLVRLMAFTADTNLVARGGEPALRAVWAWARGLVQAERDGVELRGERFLAELRRADADFSARRWSPGGSADLLALSWFCHRLG